MTPFQVYYCTAPRCLLYHVENKIQGERFYRPEPVRCRECGCVLLWLRTVPNTPTAAT
jgi:hypothetical protein